MPTLTRRIAGGALAMALSALMVPGNAAAQEAMEQCTATINPMQVASGHAAVEVKAELTSSIGEVTSFDAPSESGLAIAAAEDVKAEPMAEAGEQMQERQAIAHEGESTVTLWLTTANAVPGSYEVRLEGAEGTCAGEITVAEAGEEKAEYGMEKEKEKAETPEEAETS